MNPPAESFYSRIQSSPLYNDDLAPATSEHRTWGLYNYAALWVSMSVNILTYMLAASLIQGGMNWKQVRGTVCRFRCWLGLLSEFWVPMLRPCCGRWWPAVGLEFRHGSAEKRSAR